jgi:hypothetical protein
VAVDSVIPGRLTVSADVQDDVVGDGIAPRRVSSAHIARAATHLRNRGLLARRAVIL